MDVSKVSAANTHGAMGNNKDAKEGLGASSAFSNLFGNLIASSSMAMGMDNANLFSLGRANTPVAAERTERPEPEVKDDPKPRNETASASNSDRDEPSVRDDRAERNDHAKADAKDSTRDDRDHDTSARGGNDDRADTNDGSTESDAGTTDDGTEQQAAADDTANADSAGDEVAVAADDDNTIDPNLAALAGITNAQSGDANQGRDQGRNQSANADAAGKVTDAANKGQEKAFNPNEHAARGMERAESKAATNAKVNTATTGPQETADDAELPSLLQQQRADLSKRMGDNRPVNVTVNTQNQNAQVTSQSSAMLGANVVATEAEAQVKNAPQTSNRPTTANPNVVAQTASTQGAVDPQQILDQQAIAAQAAARQAANVGPRTATTQTNAQPTATATPVGDASASGAAAQANTGQQTAAAKRPSAAQMARPQHLPQATMQQISVNITKAVSQGTDRISIQLRPAELGRVDVQLDLSGGRVSATIIADRPETLEMLRNDSRTLEKALQDAGLDTNAGDLNYSLRGENDDAEKSAKGSGGDASDQDDDLEQQLKALTAGDLETGIIEDDRIDIRA